MVYGKLVTSQKVLTLHKGRLFCLSSLPSLIFSEQSVQWWQHYFVVAKSPIIIKKSQESLELLVGAGAFCIALTLFSAGWMPRLSSIWPRYSSWVLPNSHFERFTHSPFSCKRWRTLWRLRRWSFSECPIIRMSSRKTTTGKSFIMFSIILW